MRATGGLDYNLAEAHVGNADLTLAYIQRRLAVTGGLRRYRPYFSLWTLWSAFSPVPHNGVFVSADVRVTDMFSVRTRGEAYRFESADVSTALVPQLEDDGWRGSLGGTATLNRWWTADADLGVERGPGASGRFAQGTVTWTPNEDFVVDVYGGAVARPLELRYYDATSRWVGSRADASLGSQRRVWADLALVDDERDRPDAGASSLSQFRLRAGVSVSFGTAADRVPLPPGRPRRQ